MYRIVPDPVVYDLRSQIDCNDEHRHVSARKHRLSSASILYFIKSVLHEGTIADGESED